MSDILGRLPQEFTLADVHAHNSELSQLFPQNKHVDAKVRQTLQILRDRGALEFLGNGRYRKRTSP
ncbi:MAG: restriction endonuclease, partial [Candidatus Tumulicola sp.]